MKRIYFIRHANAGQTPRDLISDHDRELTDRGEMSCLKAAKYLQKNFKDKLPEEFYTSTAVRSIKTAILTTNELKKIDKKFSGAALYKEQELYIPDSENILNVINTCVSDDIASIAVVSHNPGLHAFLLDLPNKGDKKKYREMKNKFPPCSIATFDINVDKWFDVKLKSAELLDFIDGNKLKAI